MAIEQLHGISKTWVSKAILGVIAVSFVISGVAGYMFTQQDTSAVKVNGEEVSQRSFQQTYEQQYRQQSQQLGEQFAALADSPEFTTALRQNVLNELINQELLRQYVKELNLDVSDEHIKMAIVSSPIFQTNGKFDNAKYQQLLTGNGITAETYAGYMRQDLKLTQLQNGILASDFVAPAQAEMLAKAFFQVRKVRLAQLPLAAEIAKQTVTEQEMQDYYNNNKAAFLEPEQVKVQYLDLNRKALEDKIKVTDVEVAQYYQDNKAQYMQQHLAHIQLANEQDANRIYQDLQNGSDFAELAKINSQDKPSAVNGGDLSWLPAGALPMTFEAAANSLAVGQYSQPVKVDNSYHIIKVLERKERPLDQVKAEITTKVRNDLFANEFYKVEKQADEKAFEDQSSLNAAAQAAGVKINETSYFSRNDVPQALNYPNVVSNIFSDNLVNGGANSNAISVGEQHSVVFRVVDHKAEGIKPFEQAKADIESYLKRQKAEAVVLTNAADAVKALSENADATVAGVSFGAEQQFSYINVQDPVLANSIFTMSKPQNGKPTFQAVRSGNGDIAIAKLTQVDEPTISEQDMTSFTAQYAQMQQADMFAQLLQALRAKAKIEVNESFINQASE
ncbi:peptidyl-prolyl cis-trans isomerase D [Cricetibacter osteomyelitidis]|uniref:Periplasmic chaperone PpiD n=1 Tax=Cricetibacter osteomyelitidis TaxID=1521931 RepID=A0A4R2TCX5_9PAST|nr:peptidylprolyl isomerase [Cricetibacter osteomyelitidis]TCP94958.1 peptidyl-prolyl cis-trans isomerase D [Cricetibacter osteomyelitidis]